MSAITAKASRKMKKYAVLTREPRCFLGSFDFSWEQRKFSELVQIERGGSPRPIDDFITDAPNGLNWVKIGDAPTQGNYITKTAEKIRPEGLSKTREVHPGDLILSNSMSFGKPYIMGIDGCIHDGWLLIRNTYGVFDLTFLCHLLGTPQMLSQYRSLAAGSTVNNLNKELVGNTYVTIPSITEQRVLGAYLEQLDNLITLHQRKCANLCSPSQVVLSLLFATSTFSWEQRKLGELGTITTGNTPSTSIPDYYSDDGIVWVTPTDICENITFESARKLSDLGQQVGRVVPKNTILVTCIASIGKNTMLGNTGSFNQQINGLTPNENKYDPYFLLTESALWSAKMKGSAAAGTMQIVNRTEFSELKTWLPSLIEQQAIGAFFKQLDHLITLHQRKPFLMKWRTSDANRNQTNRLVL